MQTAHGDCGPVAASSRRHSMQSTRLMSASGRGLNWDTIRARHAEAFAAFDAAPGTAPYLGGESYANVLVRVLPVFAAVCSDRHPGGRVCVVAHNVVNRAYLSHLLGLDINLAKSLPQSNCGVNVIEFDPATGRASRGDAQRKLSPAGMRGAAGPTETQSVGSRSKDWATEPGVGAAGRDCYFPAPPRGTAAPSDGSRRPNCPRLAGETARHAPVDSPLPLPGLAPLPSPPSLCAAGGRRTDRAARGAPGPRWRRSRHPPRFDKPPPPSPDEPAVPSPATDARAGAAGG